MNRYVNYTPNQYQHQWNTLPLEVLANTLGELEKKTADNQAKADELSKYFNAQALEVDIPFLRQKDREFQQRLDSMDISNPVKAERGLYQLKREMAREYSPIGDAGMKIANYNVYAKGLAEDLANKDLDRGLTEMVYKRSLDDYAKQVNAGKMPVFNRANVPTKWDEKLATGLASSLPMKERPLKPTIMNKNGRDFLVQGSEKYKTEQDFIDAYMGAANADTDYRRIVQMFPEYAQRTENAARQMAKSFNVVQRDEKVTPLEDLDTRRRQLLLQEEESKWKQKIHAEEKAQQAAPLPPPELGVSVREDTKNPKVREDGIVFDDRKTELIKPLIRKGVSPLTGNPIALPPDYDKFRSIDDIRNRFMTDPEFTKDPVAKEALSNVLKKYVSDNKEEGYLQGIKGRYPSTEEARLRLVDYDFKKEYARLEGMVRLQPQKTIYVKDENTMAQANEDLLSKQGDLYVFGDKGQRVKLMDYLTEADSKIKRINQRGEIIKDDSKVYGDLSFAGLDAKTGNPMLSVTVGGKNYPLMVVPESYSSPSLSAAREMMSFGGKLAYATLGDKVDGYKVEDIYRDNSATAYVLKDPNGSERLVVENPNDIQQLSNALDSRAAELIRSGKVTIISDLVKAGTNFGIPPSTKYFQEQSAKRKAMTSSTGKR